MPNLLEWLKEMGLTAAAAGLPLLLTAAAVGLIVAIFQGATQINDQSLPLTLKIAATAAVVALFGTALAEPLFSFAEQAFGSIAGDRG